MELDGNRIHLDPHNWAESGDEDATEIGSKTDHKETYPLYIQFWTQHIPLGKIEMSGNNPTANRSNNCETCEKIPNTKACFKNHIETTHTDGALK